MQVAKLPGLPLNQRKVDDLQRLGQVVALHELPGVAVGGAEEQYIDLLQRQLVGEDKVCFSVQSFVYVGDFVSGVA